MHLRVAEKRVVIEEMIHVEFEMADSVFAVEADQFVFDVLKVAWIHRSAEE